MNDFEWNLLKTDDQGALGSVAGKFSDFLRGRKYKKYGHFADTQVQESARMLAREFIQNSRDSFARRNRAAEKNSTARSSALGIDFEFRTLEGDERKAFRSATNLKQLWSVLNKIDSSSIHKAATQDEFDRIKGILGTAKRKLNVLYIHENGTAGMGPGTRFHMSGNDRMWKALASVGRSGGNADDGGSFGYGKTALIRAGHARIVFAYSAFGENSEFERSTGLGPSKTGTRFMGMAYFDAFKSDGIDYEGWCSLGQQIDEVTPCEGSDADSFAEALGMKKRDANNPDDWGSTFVIIEPDFSSNDLKAAIEQYWFPLLADDSNPLKVTISDQGTPMTLSAKDNIDVEGYFLAETERLKLNQIEPVKTDFQDEGGRHYRYIRFGKVTNQHTDKLKEHVGKLGFGELVLFADLNGFSFDSNQGRSGEERHTNLIAKVRNVGLVVEYQKFDTRLPAPYVRGVYRADDGLASQLLQRTEPQLHECWTTEPDDDIPEDASIFAKKIEELIREEVVSFIKEHTPEEAKRTGNTRIAKLDELMSSKKGRGKGGRKGKKSISSPVSQTTKKADRKILGNNEIVYSATFAWEIREKFLEAMKKAGFDNTPLPSKITLSYSITDGNGDHEVSPSRIISIPDGWEREGDDNELEHTFSGEILPGSNPKFVIESRSHSADWAGNFERKLDVMIPKKLTEAAKSLGDDDDDE